MTAIVFPDLEREARIFCRYLIGAEPPDSVLLLYQKAHEVSEFPLNDKETKLLRFIYRHPGSAGLIDSGLALARGQSTIRKKLFYLLGILETLPEYSGHYLCPDRVPLKGLPRLTSAGSLGLARMLLGYVIVRAL